MRFKVIHIIRLIYRFPVFTMAASGTTVLGSNSKPKLIVFDLDYTLWPFWVDTHVDPPFRKEKNGEVYDVHKREVTFYPEVPAVLLDLHSQGYKLGIASRTSSRTEANMLTDLFDWDWFFHFREIYPGSKTTHFKKLHRNSGIAYEDMIFFDDEHRNIVEVGKMGVLCIFVEDGVNRKLVDNALQQFSERKRQQQPTQKQRGSEL